METVRPLPLPPVEEPPAASRRPASRWRRAAVGVVAALVVGGAVVSLVTRHRTHVRADLRRVLVDLPVGWQPVAAKDAGVDTGPPFPDGVQIVLLGTAGDPTAPALELVWRADDVGPGFEALAATTGMERMDTRRGAACSEVNDGTHLCYLDERGIAIQLRANQVPLAEITELIDGVQLVDGELVVDTAAIPSDLELLASFTRTSGGRRGLVGIGNADHPSVASVLYAGPGDDSALLVVGDADQQEFAYAAVFTRWHTTQYRGRVYYVGTGGDGISALWRADGVAYRLRISASLGEDQLLRTAASVRAPEGDEWTRIPPRPRYDAGVALGG